MTGPVLVARDGLDAPEFDLVGTNEVLHTVVDTDEYVRDEEK
jgi:hypothetical protein